MRIGKGVLNALRTPMNDKILSQSNLEGSMTMGRLTAGPKLLLCGPQKLNPIYGFNLPLGLQVSEGVL